MRSDWFISILESWNLAQTLNRNNAVVCSRLIKSASIAAGGRVADLPENPDIKNLQAFAIQRAKAALNRYVRFNHNMNFFEQLITPAITAEQLITHLQNTLSFARGRNTSAGNDYARDTLYEEFLQWNANEVAGRVLLTDHYPAQNAVWLKNGDYLKHVISTIRQAKKEILVAVGILVWDGSESHPTKRLVDALCEAIKKGVRVELYNAVGNSFHNNTKVGRQIQTTLSRIVKYGGHIVTRKTARSFHAKLLIVDQRSVVVGSHNWSGNSLMNHTELSLGCESTALAAAFSRTLQRG